METTTHTPGPWTPGGRGGNLQPDSCKTFQGKPYQETARVHATDEDGYLKGVAHVYQGEGGTGSPQALAEQDANMALICAAPELLEQLKEARQYIAKVATNIALFANIRLDRMDAAIAKAEGGAA